MSPSSEKTGSLTSHVSWLMLAKTFSFVFSVALPMVLVRRLNRTEFGLYKQLFLVVGTSVVVLSMGFGMSAYYFLLREPERQREIVSNVMLFNLVMGLVPALAFLFYPPLLGIIFSQPQLASYAPLVGLVILLWMVAAFLEIAPIVMQEIKLASAAIVAIQLSRTFLYLAAVLVFGTVRALVYAAVLQGLLQNVLMMAYLHARFPGFWRYFDWTVLRRQLSYALPIGIGALLLNVEGDLHNYFVSNRFGPTVFALYAVGTVQLPFLNLLQDATNAVMILRVAVLQHENKTAEILRLTAAAMRKLAAIYFPACIFFLVFRREFITFLFTAQYKDSANIFAVNLMLLPMAVLLYDPLFRAFIDQRYFLLRLRLVLCAAMAAALWFAIGRFGLMGAISVVVATIATERVVTLARICRILGVQWSDIRLLKDVGKVTVAACLAGVAAVVVRAQMAGWKPLIVLAAGGGVFGLVYAGAVFGLGTVTAEERAIIRAKLASAPMRVRAAG